MRIISLLIPLLSIFLLSSCSKDDNPTDGGTGEDVLLPLIIGNEWRYQMFTYDTSGVVLTTSNDTTTASEQRVQDGTFSCYCYRMTLSEIPQSDT